MLVKCCVEVNSRLLQSSTVLGKASRGAIGMYKRGKGDGKSQNRRESAYHIVVYTNKYKNGFKYRVKGNIVQVFSRFVENGRATISCKEPQHDLSISQANPSDLKKLLHGIKLVCKGEDVTEELHFTQNGPLRDVFEGGKKELKIKSRKNYPLSQSFPASLCKLLVNNCGLVKFDHRITKLSLLTVLNLNENKLSDLPESMEELACLKELYLAKNKFLAIPAAIFRPKLRSSLRLLDMSVNQLKEIPPQICLMSMLTNLKLDNNSINNLPYNIEMLTSLKYLSIAKNKLKLLPHGFCMLSIDSLDLSGNPLNTDAAYYITSNRLKDIPTLFEIAARQIKDKSLAILHKELPLTIEQYMSTARTCLCGKSCFDSHAVYITMIDLGKVAHTVTADILDAGRMSAPAEGYICSIKCYMKWNAKPNALWH